MKIGIQKSVAGRCSIVCKDDNESGAPLVTLHNELDNPEVAYVILEALEKYLLIKKVKGYQKKLHVLKSNDEDMCKGCNLQFCSCTPLVVTFGRFETLYGRNNVVECSQYAAGVGHYATYSRDINDSEEVKGLF